jgi:hypothetical protein
VSTITVFFSENLKGRLGKIEENNIKIDSREMDFEGVQRLGGLNVIFITPTLLEIINFKLTFSFEAPKVTDGRVEA